MDIEDVDNVRDAIFQEASEEEEISLQTEKVPTDVDTGRTVKVHDVEDGGDSLLLAPILETVKVAAAFIELKELCFHSYIPKASMYPCKTKRMIAAKWTGTPCKYVTLSSQKYGRVQKGHRVEELQTMNILQWILAKCGDKYGLLHSSAL